MPPPQRPKSEPPSECWSGTMLGVYHDQLPHWVVDYGCYSLTFHCRDSLPAPALEKLREIVESDHAIESCDEAFLAQSRRRFRMMEHYLDQSSGDCPFRSVAMRESLEGYLANYKCGLQFRSWVIMPNHIHFLTEPLRFESVDGFKAAIKEYKMKSTIFVNRLLGRSGALWMTSGYDRWVRDAVEYQRWIDYLRRNPVKAGLCAKPEDWVGLR